MGDTESKLTGFSLIGGKSVEDHGAGFFGANPADASRLEPQFFSATSENVELAASLATEAFPVFAHQSGQARARFLRAIGENLTAGGAPVIDRAHLETGLPLTRLQGELGRTIGQLKMFAEVLEEGSWVDARIDGADPARKPAPRPDIRSMLRPIGPVVVFGASNFPLAFSVAGGDTASALAAGNPVLVKAHPAHPGTSELVGKLVQKAVKEMGLPAGVFSLLFDASIDVGIALVKHPAVKAVAFTGSAAGGQALMRLAAERPEPIPCYAEMGSTNPMFILPGAMRDRGAAIAQGLLGSFTLGSGQFCTKPGLVFVPQQEGTDFVQGLQSSVTALGPHGMLTQAIAKKYSSSVRKRMDVGSVQAIAVANAILEDNCAAGTAALFEVSLDEFLADPELEEEIFGPTTLLVKYGDKAAILLAAEKLHGHLTATIHGTEEDLANADDLIRILDRKVGRILFNGYPTGVEVCHAMVHGGPYPATSDGRSTSVGSRAIFRFARQVCYQDCPDAALPAELRKGNPLGVMRMVNGRLTREAQS